MKKTTKRARELGVMFKGDPGRHNAITDVEGVEIGYTTIHKLPDVNTGVTIIHPRGRGKTLDPVYGAHFVLNGNGEMTGTQKLEELGFLHGPLGITNTNSVGIVRDTIVSWNQDQVDDDSEGWMEPWSCPVVTETWDGYLNDIGGFHVKPRHVLSALNSARSGTVAEGNVGGGTGMISFEFKSGTGTSSRKVGDFMLGVLVQSNFGLRDQLMINGMPIGEKIPGEMVPTVRDREAERGSCVVVIATDAPMLPCQLKRIARRATHGLARTGGMSGSRSGDIFVAFSTANEGTYKNDIASIETVSNDLMDWFFNATIYATEEAIINALTAGETMKQGPNADAAAAYGIPYDVVRKEMIKRRRIDKE